MDGSTNIHETASQEIIKNPTYIINDSIGFYWFFLC